MFLRFFVVYATRVATRGGCVSRIRGEHSIEVRCHLAALRFGPICQGGTVHSFHRTISPPPAHLQDKGFRDPRLVRDGDEVVKAVMKEEMKFGTGETDSTAEALKYAVIC